MTTYSMKRAVPAALAAALAAATLSSARADINDYEFQLVKNELKKGEAVIAVRLINKLTKKPVPDAIIFATRLDMSPDGMREMTTKVTSVPSSESGVYQFKANLSMAGGWQLSLGAKVQGETGSVASKLVLKAVP